MKSKSRFTISKERGPIFSHFLLQSGDGFDEIRIITGGDSSALFSVVVQCCVSGVKSAVFINSREHQSFETAVNLIANTVRCLAVGTLRQREFLLETVLEFGPDLPIGTATGTQVFRRSAPLEAPTQPNVSPSPSPEGEGRGEGSVPSALRSQPSALSSRPSALRPQPSAI